MLSLGPVTRASIFTIDRQTCRPSHHVRRCRRRPLCGPETEATRKLTARPETFAILQEAIVRLPCIHFRGRPRFAKTRPCESAVLRSWPASLSASLRSGPGGNRRARSNASAARISRSTLSGPLCVSLLMIQLVAIATPGKPSYPPFIDSRETALFPASDAFVT
jgi:hypothetical protein